MIESGGVRLGRRHIPRAQWVKKNRIKAVYSFQDRRPSMPLSITETIKKHVLNLGKRVRGVGRTDSPVVAPTA